MPWTQLDDEFTIDDIGARLLANLARGMYTHEGVLREYVQNACDSYQELNTLPEHPTINVRVVDNFTISIQDNGIGMDEAAIKACKKIAVSPKSELDGNMTGFRGIGIWAGFQACDRLEIETTKEGDGKRYRLAIDFAKILEHVHEDINIKELLDDRFRIEADGAPETDHYTIVKLLGLQGDYLKLTDAEELKRIVSQNLPCKIDPQFEHATALSQHLHGIEGYQEFPILVEGGEVFQQFPADLEKPCFKTLTANGEEYARCWYCSDHRSITPREFQYRSFRLRIRNFAVGPIGIYDDEDGSAFGIVNKLKLSSRTHLHWHVGAVHITNPAIVPDTPRTALELDVMARRAIEAIRGFYEDRIADSRALSQFNTKKKELDFAQEIVDSPDEITPDKISDQLEKLEQQRTLTRGRTPQEKVRRRLRTLLATQDLKDRRNRLITALTELLEQEAEDEVDEDTKDDVEATEEDKPDDDGGDVDDDEQPSRDKEHLEFDAEVLFSDIVHVVENKLPTDDDSITDICEGIHQVFRQHGLIE